MERIWRKLWALFCMMGLTMALGAACSNDDDDSDPPPVDDDDDDVDLPPVDDDDDVDPPPVDDDDDPGPFGDLPDSVSHIELAYDVNEPVEIIYDVWGMPHIYASTHLDMVRGLGFVHARDRWLQMDLFRRNAKGTLSELLEDLVPGTIDDDFNQRRKGLWKAAEDSLATYSPEEIEVLENYSDGVNDFWRLLGEDAQASAKAGLFMPPAYYELGVTPDKMPPWEPVDSVAFGKLMSFSLSDDSGSEMGRTRNVNAYRTAFAGTAWEGIEIDMLPIRPIEPNTMIDGVPNDGIQAKRGKVGIRRLASGTPNVSVSLLDEAMEALVDPLWGSITERPFSERGSNNWIVSGIHTANGQPLLANDPHLGLDYPPTFYEAHINDKLLDGEGTFNCIGVNFAASPGIVIGHNENIAWGVTTWGADVSDVWKEVYTEGSPPTVLHNGMQVDVELREEKFYRPDGSFETRIVEVVPHHGPILSKDEADNSALSWAWSGHKMPSNELGAFWNMNQASNQQEFEEALDSFRVGAQSVVSIFNNGDIFYSGESWVPTREEGALQWETPPWLVLPGQGGFDWDGGGIPEDKIPHALNPEKGYIVTANNDAVGATLDGNPLNEEYYYGAYFADGMRAFRIEERILDVINAGDKHTPQTLMDIQDDHKSPLGTRLTPHLLTALDHRADLTADDPRVAEARAYLEDWDYTSDSGFRFDEGSEEYVTEGVPEAQRRNAVATMIFNTWFKMVIPNIFDDERNLAQELSGSRPGLYGEDAVDLIIRRPEDSALADPEIYFDDIATEDVVETRDEVLVQTLIEALDFLQTTDIFNEEGAPQTSMEDWLWGKVHRLTFNHLVGDLMAVLNVPDSGPGFPRPGDIGTVDVGSHGTGCCGKNNYDYGSGPNMRMVVTFDEEGNPHGDNVLPGGNSDTMGDPHRADQADLWVNNGRHPMWFTLEDVKANAEKRFTLTPR